VQSLTTRRRDAGKLVDETDADDDADAEFSGDLLGECNRASSPNRTSSPPRPPPSPAASSVAPPNPKHANISTLNPAALPPSRPPSLNPPSSGCFAVFDGHVSAKAAKFARRRILPTLLSHGADAPGSPLETSCVAAFHALEEDFRRSVASPFSRCLPSGGGGAASKKGGGASRKNLKNAKKKTTTNPSGLTSDGVGGAQTTQKNLARNAHGGTTACVVFLQRRRGGVIPGYKGHHARRSDSVVAERVDLGAFSSSHRSPYDRVRVVHADP
jgi:hypothetical protein